MFSFILTAFFACSSNDNSSSFSTFGSSTSPNTSGSSGSSSGGTTSDDDEVSADGESPLITGADSWYTEVTGYGEVIEMHVYYTDEQDDVDGGALLISSSAGNFQEGIDSQDLESKIVLEDGELTTLIETDDTNESYTFTVQIVDASGNLSNEVETTCNPASD